MRYWEHPDWPAMAASVRAGGRTESLIAADWVEEVGGDGPVAGRVRLLAEAAQSLRGVAAIGRQVKGWAAEWLPEGERPAAGWDYLGPGPYRVGELNLEFRHGFVRRVCCTGRHLHALHQLCLREPVAEVVVCGPLWGRVGNFDLGSLESRRGGWVGAKYSCTVGVPGWPGGGLKMAQEWLMSEAEWQADPFRAQDERRQVEADFIRGSRPEGVLEKWLVPPGPRVEWCREGDGAGWVTPPPPGTRLFLPDDLHAVADWNRIARWHSDNPDGWPGGVPYDYPYTVAQRAAPEFSPYVLNGRLMDHTVVRG